MLQYGNLYTALFVASFVAYIIFIRSKNETPQYAITNLKQPIEKPSFQQQSRVHVPTIALDRLNKTRDKLVVVMVGLPGRGKTLLARKITRYLRWIGFQARMFSFARYRQALIGQRLPAEFFDDANQESSGKRIEIVSAALSDAEVFLAHGGDVAILDGSNSSKEKRSSILHRLISSPTTHHVFIESIMSDASVILKYTEQLRDSSPDFINRTDFDARFHHFEHNYEPVDPASEFPLIQFNNGGKIVLEYGMEGACQSLLRVAKFMSRTHIFALPVLLTRHGESEYNVHDRIGGNSNLTNKGLSYSYALADVIHQRLCDDKRSADEFESLARLRVWTSKLARTIQTGALIPCVEAVQFAELNEISAGICDGMTYKEIKIKYPNVHLAREADKLRYQYPEGESYLDLIARLEPVILELERERQPVLIVGHQAVIRCLYAYFLDLVPEEVPYLSVPLHTLIQLSPRGYHWVEKRIQLIVDDDEK